MPLPKRNFILQSSYQLLLIAVPLLTTPYLSRVLGASQVGVYSYTYAITNYFVIFATMGMSTYGVRAISECGDDRERRSRVFWSAFASQALVGSVVVFAYCAYAALAPQGGLLICLIWGLWVIAAVGDVSWLMFGAEEFLVPTLRAAVTRIAGVVVIFSFVKSSEDLWVYVLSIAGMYFVNQLLLWPFVPRLVDFVFPSWREVVAHLLPNFRLFLPVVAINLYTSLDKVLLGVMSDMSQVGYFEYSDKLTRMPMAVITAMGTVMMPRMVGELKRGGRESALALLEKSTNLMLILAFAFSFGIIAIAPDFAPIFLGAEFADCGSIMEVLAVIIPVVSISNVLGRQYLIPTFKDKQFTMSVFIGSVVNIVVVLAALPRMGAMGAAVATVIAELSVLATQVFLVRDEVPVGKFILNSFPFFLFGVVMAITVRTASKLFYSLWGMSAIMLAMEILLGVLVYGSLTILWTFVTRNQSTHNKEKGIK